MFGGAPTTSSVTTVTGSRNLLLSNELRRGVSTKTPPGPPLRTGLSQPTHPRIFHPKLPGKIGTLPLFYLVSALLTPCQTALRGLGCRLRT